MASHMSEPENPYLSRLRRALDVSTHPSTTTRQPFNVIISCQLFFIVPTPCFKAHVHANLGSYRKFKVWLN